MCRMKPAATRPGSSHARGIAPKPQTISARPAERDQREQRAIAVEPKPRDRRRARVAQRHEDVGGEEDDQPEDEDQQAHTVLPAKLAQ